MMSLPTGAEYRESLRDGRRVWILGEGRVEDVTTHPATRAMVEEYVAWYDRHLDPAWQDTVLAPPASDGTRLPASYIVPRTSDDLRRMGRCFLATTFLSAGNITHTPAIPQALAILCTRWQRRHGWLRSLRVSVKVCRRCAMRASVVSRLSASRQYWQREAGPRSKARSGRAR